jgi:hypothetical protein
LLVVEEKLGPCLLIAPVVQEPSFRCVGERALRKIGSYLEHCQNGESVGCVLFPSQHRQAHLDYQYVYHFVEQQKERISYYEFHPVDPLFLREVLEKSSVLERSRSLFDPGLEWRRSGRSRLCQDRPGTRCRSNAGVAKRRPSSRPAWS